VIQVWHTAINSVRSRPLCVVATELGSITKVRNKPGDRAGQSTLNRLFGTCSKYSLYSDLYMI